ncbi:MAG: phosphonoacetaldehyde reductase [Acidimicrobiia bacterium]
MTAHCVEGAIAGIADIVTGLAPDTVMLFTGGASFASSGAATPINAALASSTVIHISDVEPNPTIGAVQTAVDRYRAASPELIIAVGGGSVIDLAKSVRLLAPQPRDAKSIVLDGRGITLPPVPMVAIPTTAGTGSEATHFSVVYVDRKKHSLAHEWGRPSKSILDPELTYSVPPRITAETGLDALSQAIESLWSVRSTDASSIHASRALTLAANHLEPAVRAPTPEHRRAMCEASHLAGLAIDVTTTTAPHALSYTFTSRYGVPHGHAVALTLGAVLEHNAAVTEQDCADPRGPAFVRSRIEQISSALGASSASDARSRWDDLARSVGLATDLGSLGVKSDASRDAIADAVDTLRLSGNPRTLTPQSLRALIRSLP